VLQAASFPHCSSTAVHPPWSLIHVVGSRRSSMASPSKVAVTSVTRPIACMQAHHMKCNGDHGLCSSLPALPCPTHNTPRGAYPTLTIIALNPSHARCIGQAKPKPTRVCVCGVHTLGGRRWRSCTFGEPWPDVHQSVSWQPQSASGLQQQQHLHVVVASPRSPREQRVQRRQRQHQQRLQRRLLRVSPPVARC
jgi:hypothetical protein